MFNRRKWKTNVGNFFEKKLQKRNQKDTLSGQVMIIRSIAG